MMILFYLYVAYTQFNCNFLLSRTSFVSHFFQLNLERCEYA